MTGMSAGGPQVIAVRENADASAIVSVSSTCSAGVKASRISVRNSSDIDDGSVTITSA
jgi:hypothetical protein